MTVTSLRVLVAEDEYFIALEVERILAETGRCDVTICRSDQLESMLENHRFELVALDAGTSFETCRKQAEVIRAAEAEPVFLCAYADLLLELQQKTNFEVFEKPFREEDIKAFVATRLGERSQIPR